jgi:molecular chaperone GrpE
MSDRDQQVKVVDRRWWARGDAAPATEEIPSARKPTYIEELEQRLAGTTEQLQQVLTEYRQAQHEFDDSRARMRREVAREVDRGRRAMLAELLDVLDNLDRALVSARESGGAAADPATAFAGLTRGVALVRDQFLARLEQFGVKRIETLGQPFDAARHEAVSTAPVVDPEQDGRIVAVLKDGYASGDELLRPASVVVGSFSPNNAPHV